MIAHKKEAGTLSGPGFRLVPRVTSGGIDRCSFPSSSVMILEIGVTNGMTCSHIAAFIVAFIASQSPGSVAVLFSLGRRHTVT